MKQIITSVIICLFIANTYCQSVEKEHQTFRPIRKNSISNFHQKDRYGSVSRLYDLGKNSLKYVGKLKTLNSLIQKMDSLIETDYDEVSGLQNPYSKEEFTYENNGMLSNFIVYNWDLVNFCWNIEYKQVFAYDANWNNTQELIYTWDETTKVWLPAMKYDHNYDIDNNLTVTVYYYMESNSNSWTSGYKDEYSYDSSGYVAYRSFWDIMMGEWVLAAKIESDFDTYGYLLSQNITGWDSDLAEWVNDSKTEYTYYESTGGTEKLKMILISYWNHLQNSWTLDSKQEFFYASDGNLDEYLHSVLEGGVWHPHHKQAYNYNNQYSYNDLIIPSIFENTPVYFNHMLTDLTSFSTLNSTGGEWDNTGGMIFYYSDMVYTGINDNPLSRFITYPNPAKQSVSFSWPDNCKFLDFTLYNSNGVIVHHQVIENNTAISLANFVGGLHLYKLSKDNKQIYMNKLIIE